MKRRTLMKRMGAFAILCVLTMTMFTQPAFAEELKVELEDGGKSIPVSSPRITACEKMFQMSQMEWQLSETLYYCTLQSGGALTEESEVKLFRFKNGKSADGVITRKGIPYSQVDREFSFPTGSFTLNFGKKTLVDPEDNKTYRSVHGTDCASSVAFAWRKGTGNNSTSSSFLKRTTSNAIYTTENMFNDAMDKSDKAGTSDFIKVVGDYGTYNKTTATTTEDVVNGLSRAGQNIFNEVYAAMKPGDALLKRSYNKNGDAILGHVRLITSVKIVYKDDAKTLVDPVASYVQCIEQTGFRKYNRKADAATKLVNSNWSTSWIPNKETVQAGTYKGKQGFTGKYTFTQLAGIDPSPTVNYGDSYNCYIPIRLNAWS